MAAMRITLLAFAAMAVVISTVSAATYNVGEPGGAWDLRTDYGNWASSKKFHPGDQIVFKYSPQAHDVLEVNKADYDSCNTNSPISTLTTGNDVVSLSSTGTRYFICGFPGHCTTSGTGLMKVKIEVTPGSSSDSPAPAAGPGASNSPPPPPSSAASSVGATAGFGLAVVLLAGIVA